MDMAAYQALVRIRKDIFRKPDWYAYLQHTGVR